MKTVRTTGIARIATGFGIIAGLLLVGAVLATPLRAEVQFYVRAGAIGKAGKTSEDAFGAIEQARNAIRALPDSAFTFPPTQCWRSAGVNRANLE